MQPTTREPILQRSIIDRAPDILGADERIEAAWLEGSFAEGTATAASDVDIHVAVPDAQVEAFAAEGRQVLGQFAPVLAGLPARFGPVLLFSAMLTGPVRVDLYVEPVSMIGAIPRPLVPRVLFDRTGLTASFAVAESTATPQQLQQRVQQLIEGYLFGFTWPVRLAQRGDWSLVLYNAMQVVSLFLVPAMLLQTAPEKGLRLPMHCERFLSPAQQGHIDTIVRTIASAYRPEGQEMIDGGRLAYGHQLLVAAVLEELRAAAAQHGVPWPEESEAAVRTFFRDELGLDL